MAIWSKGNDTTNELIHQFTVGDDYICDRQLAVYDILGSIAHATMLGDTGIITTADCNALITELQQLHKDYTAGIWTVDQSDEDVHSKVEALLTERIGEPAKCLHTGRSRNDQVLTDVRLWSKDRLCDISASTLACVKALLTAAQKYEFHPLPGYTHLQRGMPSSVGLFFASHAAALLDNCILLDAAWQLCDRCPLGSGASYGVGLPLNREHSAQLLGFTRPTAPAMTDANSRGKIDTAVIDAAGALINDLSRFAADMVFFTSAECGFFTIGAGFTTGSSIMPQKKNLDLFELLRGRASRFLGVRTGLYATTLGLHSGYSRDLQDTKALLIDGLRLTEEGLAVVTEAAPTLTPQRDAIERALTPDLYATDEAYRLVTEEGLSFRDAYVQVGTNLDTLSTPDHDATIRNRNHTGSTGNIGISAVFKQVDEIAESWNTRRETLHTCWNKLL